MSTPPHHDDRHTDCGGMWIGGICARCQKACECLLCLRLDARSVLGRSMGYVDKPTRMVEPQDVKPGRWSEYDGE
ncbi:MAG: hypothetical protein O7G84_01010 [Gammaproteobacteria bacterium]|nr:hypothetical protein [Gammaproteobacteria bacterium]